MKFPYYCALEVVYGLESPDRVDEEAAEGFDDAFKSIEVEDIGVAGQDLSNEGDDEANSVTQGTDTNTASSSTSKKQKKRTSPTEKDPKRVKTSAAPAPSVAENIGVITGKLELILDHLATIATSMSNEDKHAQLVADRSNNVVKELLKLGFSNGDLFRAADIFCEESAKLNVFFQLPLHMRRQYVNHLLYPTSSPSAQASKRS